jgi:hypothetical protein
MPDKTWKKFERSVARWFGCERTGPMQSKDASDINHHCLHVQCKHSKRIAMVTLWDAAKDVSGDKIPVVAVKQKGRRGFWLFVHSDDLRAVSEQRWLAARKELGIDI